jgi:hypothetical protein
MTGGEIDIDSGENFIHLNPTAVDITGAAVTIDGANLNLNSGTINLDGGHVRAKSAIGDDTYFFVSADGGPTAVGNPGAGMYAHRQADGLYSIYMGSINASNQYSGSIWIRPDTTDTFMTLQTSGRLSMVGFPIEALSSPGMAFTNPWFSYIVSDRVYETMFGCARLGANSYNMSVYRNNVATDVMATTPDTIAKVAGTTVRNSYSTEIQVTVGVTLTKLKTITFTKGLTGTVTTRIRFKVNNYNTGSTQTTYARLYKNGVALGTSRSWTTPKSTIDQYTEYSENFTTTFNPGDTLELWANAPSLSNCASYSEEMEVKYDNADLIVVASSNS